jgi:hypothetical protein
VRNVSAPCFPHVVLGFAIMVHKSQGLTLDKEVLDISEKDFAVGLSMSRVKAIDGIMFSNGFGISRFTSKVKPSVIRRLPSLDKDRWALQVITDSRAIYSSLSLTPWSGDRVFGICLMCGSYIE